jgi:hypothetical protein
MNDVGSVALVTLFCVKLKPLPLLCPMKNVFFLTPE